MSTSQSLALLKRLGVIRILMNLRLVTAKVCEESPSGMSAIALYSNSFADTCALLSMLVCRQDIVVYVCILCVCMCVPKALLPKGNGRDGLAYG